jgi:hypothetical protein
VIDEESWGFVTTSTGKISQEAPGWLKQAVVEANVHESERKCWSSSGGTHTAVAPTASQPACANGSYAAKQGTTNNLQVEIVVDCWRAPLTEQLVVQERDRINQWKVSYIVDSAVLKAVATIACMANKMWVRTCDTMSLRSTHASPWCAPHWPRISPNNWKGGRPKTMPLSYSSSTGPPCLHDQHQQSPTALHGGLQRCVCAPRHACIAFTHSGSSAALTAMWEAEV